MEPGLKEAAESFEANAEGTKEADVYRLVQSEKRIEWPRNLYLRSD